MLKYKHDIVSLMKFYIKMFSLKYMYSEIIHEDPKGLRAESTRAVTGRRCPHSGEGKLFLMGQLDFFYENCCNSETESRKINPKVCN